MLPWLNMEGALRAAAKMSVATALAFTLLLEYKERTHPSKDPFENPEIIGYGLRFYVHFGVIMHAGGSSSCLPRRKAFLCGGP